MSGQAAFLPVPIYDADAEPISREDLTMYEVRDNGVVVEFCDDRIDAEHAADLYAKEHGVHRDYLEVVEVVGFDNGDDDGA